MKASALPLGLLIFQHSIAGHRFALMKAMASLLGVDWKWLPFTKLDYHWNLHATQRDITSSYCES